MAHRLDALDVAVVVCAQKVDAAGVAAVELVLVVGDVRREVGVGAVCLDEHAIFVVAEVRGAEPRGAVLLVDEAQLVELCDGLGDNGLPCLVFGVQGALGEPHVEVQPEVREHVLVVAEDGVVGHVHEGCLALLGAGLHPLEALLADDLDGDVDDVGACVAVFGELGAVLIRVSDDVIVGLGAGHALLHEGGDLQVAARDRLGEDVHLVAGIVDVELAGDLVAGEFHDAAQGVAQGCPAAVAQVHGAGGVGRDELDVDLGALAHGAAAKAAALLADAAEHALQSCVGEAQVDEAGSGDLDGAQQLAALEVLDEDGCDVARVHVRLLGASHGNGGSPVTVGAVARTLQGRVWDGLEGELAGLDGLLESCSHDLFHLFAHLAVSFTRCR